MGLGIALHLADISRRSPLTSMARRKSRSRGDTGEMCLRAELPRLGLPAAHGHAEHLGRLRVRVRVGVRARARVRVRVRVSSTTRWPSA